MVHRRVYGVVRFRWSTAGPSLMAFRSPRFSVFLLRLRSLHLFSPVGVVPSSAALLGVQCAFSPPPERGGPPRLLFHPSFCSVSSLAPWVFGCLCCGLPSRFFPVFLVYAPLPLAVPLLSCSAPHEHFPLLSPLGSSPFFPSSSCFAFSTALLVFSVSRSRLDVNPRLFFVPDLFLHGFRLLLSPFPLAFPAAAASFQSVRVPFFVISGSLVPMARFPYLCLYAWLFFLASPAPSLLLSLASSLRSAAHVLFPDLPFLQPSSFIRFIVLCIPSVSLFLLPFFCLSLSLPLLCTQLSCCFSEAFCLSSLALPGCALFRLGRCSLILRARYCLHLHSMRGSPLFHFFFSVLPPSRTSSSLVWALLVPSPYFWPGAGPFAASPAACSFLPFSLPSVIVPYSLVALVPCAPDFLPCPLHPPFGALRFRTSRSGSALLLLSFTSPPPSPRRLLLLLPSGLSFRSLFLFVTKLRRVSLWVVRQRVRFLPSPILGVFFHSLPSIDPLTYFPGSFWHAFVLVFPFFATSRSHVVLPPCLYSLLLLLFAAGRRVAFWATFLRGSFLSARPHLRLSCSSPTASLTPVWWLHV